MARCPFTKFWGLRQPLFCRKRNIEPREPMVLSLNEDSFLPQKHKPTKGRLMKTRNAILSVFGLILPPGVSSVQAPQPPQIPAWYNGQIEHVIPGVSENVVGVDHNGSAHHANPIYVVLPVSTQDVQEVN